MITKESIDKVYDAIRIEEVIGDFVQNALQAFLYLPLSKSGRISVVARGEMLLLS